MSWYSWLKTSSWISGKMMLIRLAGTRMNRRVVPQPELVGLVGKALMSWRHTHAHG